MAFSSCPQVRTGMRMTSWARLKPGKIVLVVARPALCPFRADRIEIAGEPSRWRVHDIKVGARSQGPKNTFQPPIPGEHLDAKIHELQIKPCQTVMDFVMAVEYVGPLADGEVFMAEVTGIAAL
jgi:hypothetical protein